MKRIKTPTLLKWFSAFAAAIALPIATSVTASAAPKPVSLSHEAAGDIGSTVTSEIRALGANATERQVGQIVYAQTKANPDAVLVIVHFAVLASPSAYAPEIVGAAIAASPDPWKKVVYHRYTGRTATSRRDYKDIVDSKEIVDAKDEPGRPMTLSDAIVQAAEDARSGLDQYALIDAANEALVGSPQFLLLAATDSSIIGATGDHGNSNYGNEPVLAPVPPPVSK